MAEWAAPIVAVFKDRSSVRICGDFQVTVNPKLDRYRIPRSRTKAGAKVTLTLNHTCPGTSSFPAMRDAFCGVHVLLSHHRGERKCYTNFTRVTQGLHV